MLIPHRGSTLFESIRLLTHRKIFVQLIDKYNNICYNTIRKEDETMKSYSSRDVIKALTEDGWYEVNTVGSHHQFKHPTKKGRVTVKHPDKDMPRKTLDSIERQSGLRFR